MMIYAIDALRPGQLADDKLAGYGLGHLKTPATKRRLDGPGPGGVAALLFAGAGTPSKRIHYDPARQRWARSLNGKFWLGHWLDAPPTPTDLQRGQPVAGHDVTLEDGRAWHIPCARIYGGGTRLPTILRRTADGLAATVRDEYRDFCRRAEALWDVQLALVHDIAPTADWTFADQWDLCTEALAVNYHVGPDEINLLGLFSSRNLNDIGAAVVDMPTVAAYLEEKKKTPPPSGG